MSLGLAMVLAACGAPQRAGPSEPPRPEPSPASSHHEDESPALDPDRERREAALGPLVGLDPRLLRALDPAGFEPLAPPQPGSWRDRVHEPSQGFDDFIASSHNALQPDRRTLVLMPLGNFPIEIVVDGAVIAAVATPELFEMRGFLQVYFGLSVDVVTPMPISEVELPTREHSGRRQYDATALVEAFMPVLPEHAYSMTVLINHDLFVAPERDYGFGYATHDERMAVMSFARLDPVPEGALHGIEAEEQIRLRAYKLLAHEVAHTFGLRHCDHYACVMNGVADELELDQTPLHLCPVCLRKLLHLTRTDPQERYEALARWYTDFSVDEESRWVRQRLVEIES